LPLRASFRKLGDVLFGICQEIADESILDRNLLCALAGCLAGLTDGDALDQLHDGRPVEVLDLHVLSDQLEPSFYLKLAALPVVELLINCLEFIFQLCLLHNIT